MNSPFSQGGAQASPVAQTPALTSQRVSFGGAMGGTPGVDHQDTPGSGAPHRVRGILPTQPTPRRSSKATASLAQSYEKSRLSASGARGTPSSAPTAQSMSTVGSMRTPMRSVTMQGTTPMHQMGTPQHVHSTQGPAVVNGHPSIVDTPPTEPLLKRHRRPARRDWQMAPSDQNEGTGDAKMELAAGTATTGDEQAPHAQLDEARYWVTVYGFPPAQLGFVLEKFRQYGDITAKMLAPNGGNWVHIRYQSSLQAQVALSKHEKVWQTDSPMMIGVNTCTDKVAMGLVSAPESVHAPTSGVAHMAAAAGDVSDLRGDLRAVEKPHKTKGVEAMLNYVMGW